MRVKTAIAGLLVLPGAAWADETQTYAYDALGRLVAVQYTGTVNAGQAHSLCYDPAGNRTVYRSNAAGALADCPSSPQPPANQPPVANADGTSMAICSFKTVDVIANDTDADGDLPLKLVGVSPGTGVLASVSGTTSVALESTSEVGTFLISYTVEDARGATGVGDLEVSVTGGGSVCP